MLIIRRKVSHKKPHNLIIRPKKYLYFYRATPQCRERPIYRETKTNYSVTRPRLATL